MRIVALALACASCSPTPASETPFDLGWGSDIESDPAAAAQAGAGLIPSELRKPWVHSARLDSGRRDSLTQIAGEGPSEHLGGDYLRQVMVHETAPRYAHGALTNPLPPGTLIVQRHSVRERPTDIISYFVMERVAPPGKPPSWLFTVLDSARKVSTRESPRACIRCHAEAPFHGVFGPPPTPKSD